MYSLNVRGTVWIAVYLVFILAPMFAMLFGVLPPARAFWTEFSMALGYAGLATMGLQFGLTARFRCVTEPWGEDVIYHFHRKISLLSSFRAPWRAKLHLKYETWHVTHLVMTVVAVTTGLLHVVGWTFYLVDPAKRALWIGLTVFRIGLLLSVRLVKPMFMLRRPYRIIEVRAEHGETTMTTDP
ncbi:MAG: hypothetical protein LH645_02735 [Actinomycetia bacterium]|nr:hypothetical protein [Actinomycetes bacterium]